MSGQSPNPRLGGARRIPRREFVCTVGGVAAGISPRLRAAEAETEWSFRSRWRGKRIWAGKEYWANPLQDWRVEGPEIIAGAAAGRSLHLLTHRVAESGQGFDLEVAVRLASSGPPGAAAGKTRAGFLFGIRGDLPGYLHALVHPRASVECGIRGDGRTFLDGEVGGSVATDAAVRLALSVRPEGSGGRAELSAQPLAGGPSARVSKSIAMSRLAGSIALAAQAAGRPGPDTTGVEWAFRDWKLGGPQVEEHPERAFGPILWTQYTLSEGTLKLMAHFPPLGDEDEWTARLETRRGGRWLPAASAEIDRLSRTAVFRVSAWDGRVDTECRTAYRWQGEDHFWHSVIRKDPREKRQLCVAVFSCDHGEVFPQDRMVRNVRLQDPDLLLYAGDQIYESYGGFGVARGKPSGEAMLDYLRKYWQFGLTWRTLLRDRPSIVIPDDHDVFQGNIWGQEGRALPPAPDGRGFERGGFLMDPAWVNAVQRTQAGHLPDPVDPEPCESGIEVYFTELRYGGASFAIIEDRKFKTGPADILSPHQRAAGRADPSILDVGGAQLLGERQEVFLAEWLRKSSDSAFRLVCSQTILCKATTHSGRNLERRLTDLDCGGWPQAARNRALSILRPGRNVIMLHGDQHIGSLVRHGIDDWEDGPVAFMVPGSCNGFPRAWWPDRPGERQPPGGYPWTGRYRDGLGNLMTVLGAANPDRNSNTREGQAGLDAEEIAHRKGSGHGVLVLDRKARTARFEIWRHAFDAAEDGTAGQFPGFPVTIDLPG